MSVFTFLADHSVCQLESAACLLILCVDRALGIQG